MKYWPAVLALTVSLALIAQTPPDPSRRGLDACAPETAFLADAITVARSRTLAPASATVAAENFLLASEALMACARKSGYASIDVIEQQSLPAN